jgi:hypothetical protein
MAQHDMNIANAGFPAVRSDINSALSAIQTNHSGTSRPTGAVAGQIWLDTTSATNPTLKFFDGTDDISLATIDYSANTVNWLDSTVSITGLSTTATSTVLTLQDTNVEVSGGATQGGEVRFKEDSDTGSNYIALKAGNPASNVTFILPNSDGTLNQAIITDGSGNLSFGDVSTTLTYTKATATGDGSTTTLTIDSGRAVDDVLVYVNGFLLTPTTDYTISSTTLTFVTAPASSAEIVVRYLALGGGGYSNDTGTGDGSTTTLTIDSGRTVEDIIVTVNGVTLVPVTDYTISATTLTFATAPALSAEISVRYLRLT